MAIFAQHEMVLTLRKWFLSITYKEVGFFFLWVFAVAIPFSKAISGIGEAAAGIIWLYALRYKEHRLLGLNLFLDLRIATFSWFWVYLLINALFSENQQQAISELNQRHYLFTVPMLIATFSPTILHRKWIINGVFAGTLVTLCIMFFMRNNRFNPDTMKHTAVIEGVRSTRLNADHQYAFTRTVSLSKGDTMQIETFLRPLNNNVIWVVPTQTNLPTVQKTAIDSQTIHFKGVFVPETDTTFKTYLYLPDSSTAFAAGLAIFTNNKLLFDRNYRDKIDLPSPFVQRPRMGLLLAICALMATFFAIQNKTNLKWLFVIVSAFFIIGLMTLKGALGQIAFLIALTVMLLNSLLLLTNRKRLLLTFALVAILTILSWVTFPAFQERWKDIYHEIVNKNDSFNIEETKTSSVQLRISYWKNTLNYLQHNPFSFGPVGDWGANLQPYFALQTPGLPVNRPHNQFLEWWLLSGILGLLLFIIAWINTALNKKSAWPKLSLAMHLLLFLSCLVDDTTATQTGASIFILFIYIISLPNSYSAQYTMLNSKK